MFPLDLRYRVRINGEVVMSAPVQSIAAWFTDMLCRLLFTALTIELCDAVEDRVINRWEYVAPFQWRCR